MVDGLRRPSTHLLILRRANRLRARRNCAFSRACNFATWMVADVSLCLSLSRTDSMAAEKRSRRLKATETKGRRHCESTYNEVTHAFTTRIFLPFKRSSGSGDGAFFSPLFRIIRWSLIETSLKIGTVRISDFSESLCSFISSKIGAQVVTETNFLVDRTLVVFQRDISSWMQGKRKKGRVFLIEYYCIWRECLFTWNKC